MGHLGWKDNARTQIYVASVPIPKRMTSSDMVITAIVFVSVPIFWTIYYLVVAWWDDRPSNKNLIYPYKYNKIIDKVLDKFSRKTK